jgi:hypothetical protein
MKALGTNESRRELMAFLACPKNVTCGGAIKVSGDDKGGDPKKKGVARRVWPMSGGLACIGESSRCWTKEGGAVEGEGA